MGLTPRNPGFHDSSSQIALVRTVSPVRFEIPARAASRSSKLITNQEETPAQSNRGAHSGEWLLQTIYQPVPVEGAFHHDLQAGFVGLQQFDNFRQLVAQLLLDHY